MRKVATKMAINYFRSLKEYLAARESGDKDIDKIRDNVVVNAELVLRQTEGTLKKTCGARRRPSEVRSFFMIDQALWKLIDFDEVERETGFGALFENLGNHFAGSIDGKWAVGLTHTQHDGLKPQDILAFLNSWDDIKLYRHQEEELIKFPELYLVATLCRNGVLDIVQRDQS